MPRRCPSKAHWTVNEFKIMTIRRCCAGPVVARDGKEVARYWRRCIATADWFNPDVECLAVILLNVKCEIMGHHFVGMGLLNSCSIHAREIFRAAIIGAAYAVILVHNHPSGRTNPSDADLKYTRKMLRAASVIGIQIFDHFIVSHRDKPRSVLKELH
jgi:DNA repair protein RadC